MEYSILGKTGLRVSKVGLGTTGLGSMYGKVSLEEAYKAVQKSFDLGINFLDSSPFYGLGKAEEVLGKALKHLQTPRDKYILATKIGRYGSNSFDFSRERVISSVDESLQRLGVEYIDLIQCHDIEFTPLDQIVNETLPALRELKESGKVRFIGITGFPLHIFKYVLDHDKDNVVDTILTYCHYTLQNKKLSSLLPYLKERNVGIINGSPLSMGLLTRKGPPEWHPAPQEIKDLCARAAAHCPQEGDDTIENLAFQYSVANPDIHVTLTGAGNVKEVESVVSSYERVAKFGYNEKLAREVEDILNPVMDQVWPSGIPQNR